MFSTLLWGHWSFVWCPLVLHLVLIHHCISFCVDGFFFRDSFRLDSFFLVWFGLPTMKHVLGQKIDDSTKIKEHRDHPASEKQTKQATDGEKKESIPKTKTETNSNGHSAATSFSFFSSRNSRNNNERTNTQHLELSSYIIKSHAKCDDSLWHLLP